MINAALVIRSNCSENREEEAINSAWANWEKRSGFKVQFVAPKGSRGVLGYLLGLGS